MIKQFNSNAYITELHIDASGIGLSGMSMQCEKEDTPLHMVHCVSKMLTDPKGHYHGSKLEIMEIV